MKRSYAVSFAFFAVAVAVGACGGSSSAPPATAATVSHDDPVYKDIVAYLDTCEQDPAKDTNAPAADQLAKKYTASADASQKFLDTKKGVFDERNGHGHPSFWKCYEVLDKAFSAALNVH